MESSFSFIDLNEILHPVDSKNMIVHEKNTIPKQKPSSN